MGRIRIGELDGKGFTKAKKDRRYDCWFCDDSNKHLYVSLTMLVYHCFKCGASGKIIDEVNLGSYQNIINRLKNNTKDLLADNYHWNATRIKEKLIKTLPRNVEVCSDSAIAYLHGRGVGNTEIVRNDIRECIDYTGIYSSTIIFPVNAMPESDKCDYFVARKYDDSEPKYVNAPWPKEGIVYQPSPNRRAKPINASVICEGVFDALALSRIGITHVYALLGKQATPEQLMTILKEAPRNQILYICLDSDAFTYAIKMRLELSNISGRGKRFIRVATLPPGKDPASCSAEQLREVFASAYL